MTARYRHNPNRLVVVDDDQFELLTEPPLDPLAVLVWLLALTPTLIVLALLVRWALK